MQSNEGSPFVYGLAGLLIGFVMTLIVWASIAGKVHDELRSDLVKSQQALVDAGLGEWRGSDGEIEFVAVDAGCNDGISD